MCLCVALLKELASTFQRLTVEWTSNTSVLVDLRGSTALESYCLTSIFYQPSLKKLWRSRRTVRAHSVWFGCIACDLSHCLGSLWALFVHSCFFFLSAHSSVSPALSSKLMPREAKWFPSQRNAEIKEQIYLQPKQTNTSFNRCKMSSKILKMCCNCCLVLISHYCVKKLLFFSLSRGWQAINRTFVNLTQFVEV